MKQKYTRSYVIIRSHISTLDASFDNEHSKSENDGGTDVDVRCFPYLMDTQRIKVKILSEKITRKVSSCVSARTAIIVKNCDGKTRNNKQKGKNKR